MADCPADPTGKIHGFVSFYQRSSQYLTSPFGVEKRECVCVRERESDRERETETESESERER